MKLVGKYLDNVAEPQKIKIYKTFASELKVADDTKRTLVVTISTPTPDRSQDTVQPKGMQYEHFLKNPVVLFAHKYDTKPIAKCTSLKVSDAAITATVEFLPEGVYAEADIIYTMYKEGFLNAWSIGFMPVAKEYEVNDFGGYEFKKWELFEFSSVPVPDNPEALTIMRSKGITDNSMIEAKELDDTMIIEKADEGEAEVTPNADGKTVDVSAISKETAEKAIDESKISDLTVAEFKALIAPQAVKKDVSQVTSLAYVLSELNWLSECFEYSEVKQETIDKVDQAIALLLEAVKDQAELGQKSFKLNDATKKAGRTISNKHEESLKSACDYMTKAAEQVQGVLDTVAVDDNDGDEKTVKPSSRQMKQLTHATKEADKQVGLALRMLKVIQSESKNKAQS